MTGSVKAGRHDRRKVRPGFERVPGPERGAGSPCMVLDGSLQGLHGGPPAVARGAVPAIEEGEQGPLRGPPEPRIGHRRRQALHLAENGRDVLAPDGPDDEHAAQELEPIAGVGLVPQAALERRQRRIGVTEAGELVVADAAEARVHPRAGPDPAGERQAIAGGLGCPPAVDVAEHRRAVVQGANERDGQVVCPGDPLADLDDADPLPQAALVGERGSLGHERVGEHVEEVRVLGGIEDPLRHLERAAGLLVQEVGARELTLERDGGGIREQVAELLGGGHQHGEGVVEPAPVDQRPAERGRHARGRGPVATLAMEGERAAKERVGLAGVPGVHRRDPRPREELGLVGRPRRDRQGLLEEGHGLLVGAERGGPLGRAPEGDPRLAGERVAFRTVGRVDVRGEIVAGERPGQLVRAEGLEEPRRREVADLAVGLREGVVRDLADERLDERVLAPLRAPRVRVERQELAVDKASHARLEGGL